jgi:hypothetical protein
VGFKEAKSGKSEEKMLARFPSDVAFYAEDENVDSISVVVAGDSSIECM